jgi:propionate catabolism operon transcriptional regulator
MESEHIRKVLDACGGNRTRAAEILGVSSVTLWRKLAKENDEEER